MPQTSSRAAGFLAIELIKDANIFQIPTPTPASAITAIPAPISLAASASIFFSFSLLS